MNLVQKIRDKTCNQVFDEIDFNKFFDDLDFNYVSIIGSFVNAETRTEIRRFPLDWLK